MLGAGFALVVAFRGLLSLVSSVARCCFRRGSARPCGSTHGSGLTRCAAPNAGSKSCCTGRKKPNADASVASSTPSLRRMARRSGAACCSCKFMDGTDSSCLARPRVRTFSRSQSDTCSRLKLRVVPSGLLRAGRFTLCASESARFRGAAAVASSPSSSRSCVAVAAAAAAAVAPGPAASGSPASRATAAPFTSPQVANASARAASRAPACSAGSVARGTPGTPLEQSAASAAMLAAAIVSPASVAPSTSLPKMDTRRPLPPIRLRRRSAATPVDTPLSLLPEKSPKPLPGAMSSSFLKLSCSALMSSRTMASRLFVRKCRYSATSVVSHHKSTSWNRPSKNSSFVQSVRCSPTSVAKSSLACRAASSSSKSCNSARCSLMFSEMKPDLSRCPVTGSFSKSITDQNFSSSWRSCGSSRSAARRRRLSAEFMVSSPSERYARDLWNACTTPVSSLAFFHLFMVQAAFFPCQGGPVWERWARGPSPVINTFAEIEIRLPAIFLTPTDTEDHSFPSIPAVPCESQRSTFSRISVLKDNCKTLAGANGSLCVASYGP